jgi:DNA-binding transcriptional LysR family regulator
LDNLRCFEAAATCPTFRAAARRVALTPAAFGQRIRQLEDQLNTKLFNRSTRSLALTPAGMAFLPKAREALEAVERCVTAAQSGTFPPLELTLGTRYELGLSFVLPLHEQLTRDYPSLTLHYFYGGSSAELLLRIRSREIDCAISSERLVDPALDSFQIHREDYALVAAPRLLRQTPFSRDAHAQEHTLLDINSSLPLFSYWRDAPEGGDRLRFQRIWRVGSIEPMRRLVTEGKGVAVLPLYFIREELKRGRLKTLFPTVKPVADHFRMVFRTDDARRPLFESLAEWFRRHPLR